ncbi:MAG: xylan 1,4-beta-xylosidase, partial [Planctomycetes bacterium SM23_32]
MRYTNPVIPGFYPDPSVCRVGRDYYLATSTFEYFPGVPVFHSRDLVHWRQIGHCLTRPEQLPLEGVASSEGIFAPSLRHHDGRFYMVTTNVNGGGHFYVHADDPAGPWSDPVWVKGGGFDPDLFFAPDGTVYFIHQEWGHGIRQWEIDVGSGRLSGEGRSIWRGLEDQFCEAPHIYHVEGRYYLIVAEGGTHRGHMVVCGRSDGPEGPFESCPHNPILTHRARVELPIQATGHGDLVQAHDGSWWILFLGIRPVWGAHHLGRETFLAPVTWENGWPAVNGGEPVSLEMKADGPPAHPWPAEPVRDDFEAPELRLGWNFRRNPHAEDWSLAERPGWLALHGSELTLDDAGSPAFLGRRQRHFDCRAACLIEFEPTRDGEEA